MLIVYVRVLYLKDWDIYPYLARFIKKNVFKIVMLNIRSLFPSIDRISHHFSDFDYVKLGYLMVTQIV